MKHHQLTLREIISGVTLLYFQKFSLQLVRNSEERTLHTEI